HLGLSHLRRLDDVPRSVPARQRELMGAGHVQDLDGPAVARGYEHSTTMRLSAIEALNFRSYSEKARHWSPATNAALPLTLRPLKPRSRASTSFWSHARATRPRSRASRLRYQSSWEWISMRRSARWRSRSGTVRLSARRASSAVSGSATTQTQSSFSSSPTLRSEEHTSELQSRFDLVCRLL